MNTTTRVPYSFDRRAFAGWLLTAFAYGWWALIILYFGVIDGNTSDYLKVLSTPIVAASFALIRLFQLAMYLERYGYAILFMVGLLVSGALA